MLNRRYEMAEFPREKSQVACRFAQKVEVLGVKNAGECR